MSIIINKEEKVEAAENLRDAGYNVALIEGIDQILRPFDYDMVQILHKKHTLQLWHL